MERKQWAIEQHIKKNPKCEWLCTHTKQHNLGEVLEDSTEPTIDELEELQKECNIDEYGTTDENAHYIFKRFREILSDQVAKAVFEAQFNAIRAIEKQMPSEPPKRSKE